jgi:pheromone receptor transcription factor
MTFKGHQNIEIKEIAERRKRDITFCRRRASLFKKAGELCILCGAEISIITFSRTEKVYGFSHPNVDNVLNRYLSGNSFHAYPAAENALNVDEVNKEYAELLKEMSEEEKRLAEIEEAKKTNNKMFLWDEPIDDMGLEELKHYLAALREMRTKVATKADEYMRRGKSTLQPSYYEYDVGLGNHHHYFGKSITQPSYYVGLANHHRQFGNLSGYGNGSGSGGVSGAYVGNNDY